VLRHPHVERRANGSAGIARGVAGGIAALLLVATRLHAVGSDTTAVIVGLDHIPLAVTSLTRAADVYRALGFALKPGVPHQNGIANQHAKFPDGTEIELITAGEARDALTARYAQHLAAGDGPAFVGFYAPNMSALSRRLDATSQPYSRAAGLVTLAAPTSLPYVFFGGRNRSPTDRPEDFAHPNGADSLIGVWLAVDDTREARRVLTVLGATFAERRVRVPDSANALVAELERGEVVILPAVRQLVPGRPIIGAVLRTPNLEAGRRALAAAPAPTVHAIEVGDGRRVFIPPSAALGLWLEFRELR
jgi:catechol 2,3-dioxygenase-like lactoylglutathione lyase family enzyme